MMEYGVRVVTTVYGQGLDVKNTKQKLHEFSINPWRNLATLAKEMIGEISFLNQDLGIKNDGYFY